MAHCVTSDMTTVIVLTSIDEYIAMISALKCYGAQDSGSSKYSRITYSILNSMRDSCDGLDD